MDKYFGKRKMEDMMDKYLGKRKKEDMYFEHWNGGHVLCTLEWRTCT